MEWFRWYHGAISDPKWPLIARKSGQNIGTVVSVWAAILVYASQADDRGCVDGFNPESVDALFGYEDGATAKVVEAMKNQGVIRVTPCNANETHDVTGVTLRVVSWEKRQVKRERDDNSLERVRAHRMKKKAQQNEAVSEEKPNETPCNASVTPRNTQNRTDKNRTDKNKDSIPHADGVTASADHFYLTKKKRQLKGKRLETFNRFWTAFAYPKGKAESADAWLDIPTLTDALVDEIVTAATAEALNRASVIADGRTPKFAQGWLSGRRWEDKVIQLQNMTPEEKAMKDAAEMRLILANKRAYQ